MATSMLSKHFSLAELTRTGSGLPNQVTSPVTLANLRQLCQAVLEPVREHFGKAVIVHSGYRSLAVNTAVGGNPRSQHVFGEAADFHVDGFTVYEVASWMSDSMEYDQLILENFVPGSENSGWVHCLSLIHI